MKEEIERITEQTAQELCKAFDDFIKASKEMAMKTHDFLGIAYKEAIRCAAMKLIDYCERYVNATFLTRWYWRRKMKNLAKAIIEMEHFKKLS